MDERVIFQCVRTACAFRYPGIKTDGVINLCPKCRTPVEVVAGNPALANQTLKPELQSPIHLEAYLDNIRSVHNTGSIIRSCDGCGVRVVHLGGITPPPTHPKMTKTSLGAETNLHWTQHWNGVEAMRGFKEQGYEIIALEKTASSRDLFSQVFDPAKKYLLVAGNENFGIDPEILALADQTLNLPMAGSKESLNVSVAFSIAAYWIRFSDLHRRWQHD